MKTSKKGHAKVAKAIKLLSVELI